MLPVPIAAYYVLYRTADRFGFLHRRFVPDDPAYLWISLLVTVAGILFAIWSRLTLGRNWSGTVTVKQDHRLIRTGPYALVRHPIYTGLCLACIGTAVFDGEVRSLLGVGVAFALLVQKIRLEEQFMSDQFGPEYTVYRQRVKGLVPFIW